ncbi:MAG TPA: hypothetical protein VNS80_00380 [Pseudolysinimonas sp.]|nr:hypothetical protein [Pseudolysinimonas sp.]
MRASRALGFLAGSTAIALATFFVAAPASAATLPAGQKITVSDGDFPPVGPPAVQLYNANPANAATTAVGSINGGATVNSIDVNDDGLGYGVGNRIVGDDFAPTPFLYSVDATTGAITNEVEIIPVSDEDRITACDAIDLQPNGEILVACIDGGEGLLNSYIGVVTPAGAFTPFYNSDENEEDAQILSALASNAVNGQLWVFVASDFVAYPVDRSAGELGAAVNLNLPVYGADFDRGGQLWATVDESGEGPEPSVLATVDLAAGNVIPVNTFTFNGAEQFQVSGITIWGKLAATGSAGVDSFPIALGSALLLLAGAAFIATARISRRRAL